MARLVTCPDCGASVSAKAGACPRCGRKAGRKMGLLGCLGRAFLVLVAMGLVGKWLSRDSGPAPAVAPPKSPAIVTRAPTPIPTPTASAIPVSPYHVGDQVEVFNPGEGSVTLAADERIFDERASGKRGHKPGADVFGVGPGELAQVVSAAADRVQVEMLAGNWAKRRGWIAPDHVRPVPKAEELAGDVENGLSLGRRREIYQAYYKMGMGATKEAESSFPFKDLPDDEADAKAYLSRRQSAYELALKRGRAGLVKQFKVDGKTLDKIDAEGQAKRWPLGE